MVLNSILNYYDRFFIMNSVLKQIQIVFFLINFLPLYFFLVFILKKNQMQ